MVSGVEGGTPEEQSIWNTIPQGFSIASYGKFVSFNHVFRLKNSFERVELVDEIESNCLGA